MALRERIAVKKGVALDKPIIRGTEVSVEMLLRRLAEGSLESELLEEHPELTHEDILAALEFGADAVAHWETELEEL